VASGLVPGAGEPKSRDHAALEPPALRITPTLKEKAEQTAARTWAPAHGTQPALHTTEKTRLKPAANAQTPEVATTPAVATKPVAAQTVHVAVTQGGSVSLATQPAATSGISARTPTTG
jgi:hypothetical protein